MMPRVMLPPYPNDVEQIARQSQLPVHSTYNKGVIYYDEQTKFFYVVNDTSCGNEETALDFATRNWQHVEEHFEQFGWEVAA
jgi:hypothetical protein